MWVYKKTEANLWTVGFYAPDGKWEAESDHHSEKAAAKRVHYLNGGSSSDDIAAAAMYLGSL